VFPAIVIGALIGVVELGQSTDRLVRGHWPWWEVKFWPDMRRTYVAIYVLGPLVLIAPGAAVALGHEDSVSETERIAIWMTVAILTAASLLWLGSHGRITRDLDAEAPEQKPELDTLRGREYGCLLVSFAVAFVPLAATQNIIYLGLPAAWILTLLIVMLCVWLRGEIGIRARAGAHDNTTLTILSWSVTALLAVTSLMTFAAAQKLEQTKVCAKERYAVTGLYIGETKERVYVGDDVADRVISIPADEVRRVAFGRDAATTTLCAASKTEGVKP
jgi:hypothetical protein